MHTTRDAESQNEPSDEALLKERKFLSALLKHACVSASSTSNRYSSKWASMSFDRY